MQHSIRFLIWELFNNFILTPEVEVEAVAVTEVEEQMEGMESMV